MIIQEGTRLGRYEIRSLLGSGGMGEVYLAQDTQLRRQVAIKLLPAEFTQNKVRLTRFEREAYAASSLNHPNILTIHEIGEQEGHHFIATEYVEGKSLRQHMTAAPMDLRSALDIAAQVAAALAAAHQAGIVHRDIKPENIMVRLDGLVKVLDFGLAKLADETNQSPKVVDTDPEAPTRTRVVNTEPGMVMGTANYMSPEQARGFDVDTRTDIWSLGVVLYEMVAGRLPFEGPSTTDVLSLILHHEPKSLLLDRPELPAELERIVEKALTKEREERYQTAKDCGLDLKKLKQHLQLEAELERSITPEGGAKRIGGGQAITASGVAATSGAVGATRTSEGSQPSTISSAEYIVGELKQHKRGALVGLALAVAVVAVGITYFFYFRSSQTISSIAVLPFVNASGDPNMEYLSDGLSESLINALSQLPQLKVIARSSAFKYKGKEVDLDEIARTLGVQAILTGRVAQRGDNLVVSAEIVNTRDKTQMWGEQYSRKVADVQAVQEEIARMISDKLRLRLSGSEEKQLGKRATQNPQAYQLYLNGVFYRRQSGFENVKKSLDYFNQAVALDPTYALAWTEVANANRFFATNSLIDPKQAMSQANAAAQKALELDDTLAEAHAALATIKQLEWDWVGAEQQFKRAIELNSNLAEGHFRYSVYLGMIGRHSESLAEIKRAQELDPLRIALRGQEGSNLYFARRYDEAIQQLQNTVKLDPNDTVSWVYIGYTYAAKGMYAEAIDTYQKLLRESQETSTQCYLGYALARAGRQSEARDILNKLKTTKEYVSPGELAVLYIGLDDKEGAIASLEKAYSARDLQLSFLKVDPNFDPMRADPRFQDLMRRVGLPQ